MLEHSDLPVLTDRKDHFSSPYGRHPICLQHTPRGKLFASVWLKRLRPLARKTFQTIPVKLKGKITGALSGVG